MFNDAGEADAVLDGPFGQQAARQAAGEGPDRARLLGPRLPHVTNNRRPITKWEDIQGLKIRVIQIPIFIDIFNTLGANAVPMPFPELYTALEQKAVDGQENAARDDRDGQVQRGAEARVADPHRLQPAGRDLQQEDVGHA